MEGIIKVTPEKLISASNEFSTSANQVNQLTQQMLDLIRNINSSWQGEASTAYTQKFNSLDEDMQQIFRMITEHATDLNDMAVQYQNAEQANIELSQSMKTNVIS